MQKINLIPKSIFEIYLNDRINLKLTWFSNFVCKKTDFVTQLINKKKLTHYFP